MCLLARDHISYMIYQSKPNWCSDMSQCQQSGGKWKEYSLSE